MPDESTRTVLVALGTGLGIALGLRFLLFRTRLGVGMRAVVDNRDLAALNGARQSASGSRYYQNPDGAP